MPNKYIIGVGSFGVLTYFFFAIQWNDTWQQKENCFTPISLTIADLFEFNKNSLSTEQIQEGINNRLWNLPYLVIFSQSRPEEELSNLGLSGYLMDGSYWEYGVIPLKRGTVVTLNGKVLIARHGIFSQFVNQISVISSVEAEVEGKNYVVFGFSLADNIKEKLITSRCYKSDDNT